MVKNTVLFLFPGQGSQYPGMGSDLLDASAAVRTLVQKASEISGTDIENLLRNADADTLKRTDVSQLAITAVNLASLVLLNERGVEAACCAGHSLGEYAALKAASVISMEDCFKLVSERGKLMQKAADKLGNANANPAGMAAVLGIPGEEVEALIKQWTSEGLKDLYCANFNSPSQTVIAGSDASLQEAGTRLKEAGAKRVIRLKVAGPFHSPLIRETADEFRSVLEAVSFRDPLIPVFSNVSGARIGSGKEARELSLRQICEPVRWVQEEQALIQCRPSAVLECGPGKVLQGLWKDSGADIPCVPAGTISDITAATAAILHKE